MAMIIKDSKVGLQLPTQYFCKLRLGDKINDKHHLILFFPNIVVATNG
jgi:hypothetical protein